MFLLFDNSKFIYNMRIFSMKSIVYLIFVDFFQASSRFILIYKTTEKIIQFNWISYLTQYQAVKSNTSNHSHISRPRYMQVI